MRSHGVSLSRRHVSRFKPSIRCFSHCKSRARESIPSVAPKPSVDIKHIRANAEAYSRNCLERNYKSQSQYPFTIVKLFDEWHLSQIEARSLREKRNAIKRQITHVGISNGVDLAGEEDHEKGKAELIEKARKLKDDLATTETHEAQLTSEIESLAADIPNLTSLETPRQEAKVLGYINEALKPKIEEGEKGENAVRTFQSRDHVKIGKTFDLIDFAGAAATSGWGWYYLKNEAAELEQALIRYAIHVATQAGFTAVTPPSMVYSHIASACGFRPRDQSNEQQVYDVQQSENDRDADKPSHSLAATGEIPFAGMKADQMIKREHLPIRVVGPSRCYRAEAGARGAETKGLYRVHEFTKVEMFAWTAPGGETKVFEAMLKVQKEILANLGLHCRILEMPSTDLGASASRKIDIEAYFPSRDSLNDGWGEVTSTSICTDYQTRRLNTRIQNPVGSHIKTEFGSTVNGTALAVPRVLAAILEYGYAVNGKPLRRIESVDLPPILRRYMNGTKTITKNRAKGQMRDFV